MDVNISQFIDYNNIHMVFEYTIEPSKWLRTAYNNIVISFKE